MYVRRVMCSKKERGFSSLLINQTKCNSTMKKRSYWRLLGVAGLMTTAIGLAFWVGKDRKERASVTQHSAGA